MRLMFLLAWIGGAPLVASGCARAPEAADGAVGDETAQTETGAATRIDSLPRVIERWLDVQTGSFDLDAYLELFVEDVEFHDGETGAVIRGKAELAAFVRPFTQLRDTSPTLLGYARNGDTIFVEGELRATAPDGSPAISRGVGVFHVSGSRISSFAMYMFRQSIEP